MKEMTEKRIREIQDWAECPEDPSVAPTRRDVIWLCEEVRDIRAQAKAEGATEERTKLKSMLGRVLALLRDWDDQFGGHHPNADVNTDTLALLAESKEGA